MATARTIRLWFQGLVPLTDQSQAYFDARARHVAALSGSHIAVEFHVPPHTFLPPEVTPADMARAQGGELLYQLLIADAAMTAEGEGYDGMAIGVVQDTGLRLARTVTEIPIVGYGQAAALLSRSLGSQIGLMGFNPDLFPLITRRLNAHVPGIVVAAEDIRMSYADVLRSFTEPDATALLRQRVSVAAKRLRSARADIVLPGQLLLSEAVYHAGLEQVGSINLIDGITATVTFAEAAIALRRRSKGKISRNTSGLHPTDPPIRDLIAKCARILRES